MDVQESDYPPIETLPLVTASSPEGISASTGWRTSTEPRSLRMRASREPQQHDRRRGPAEPTNGRRSGKLRGPSSFNRSEKPIASPILLDSSATVEAGVSGTSPTIDAAVAQDHDKIHDEDG